MKVKELIKELRKQDQEKEVLIQQGEDFDYMNTYTVKEMELCLEEATGDELIEFVVIEYQ